MKTLITIILILATQSLFGQSHVEKLKNQADSLFKQDKPLEALSIMEELVLQKDTINGYARYKTRIGMKYMSLDSIEKARKWFLSVMYDPLIEDNVEDYWLKNGEARGNYKHVSCYLLAISFYKEGNYDKAIDYYKQSLDTFPYYHFSGSDMNKSNVNICNNIADLYSKKGDLNTAFSYLIPFFGSYVVYSDLARNKAARIIKEHHLQEYYLTLLTKDYTVLIENETILLKLNGTKILLVNFIGQNKTKNEIEEQAKYFWDLINHTDIISELKE